MENDTGHHKRWVRNEKRCIVPGCIRDQDRRYPGPQAANYYCTEHGRAVTKHEEPRRSYRLISEAFR